MQLNTRLTRNSNTRITIITTITIFVIVVQISPIARGDFKTGGWFASKREYKGGKLKDAEKTKVQAAIDSLKALGMVGGQDITKCAECLEDLMGKNRICREDGTSKAYAATLPDGKAGCSLKDGINVNKSIINGDKCVLAGTLAHEWCHTNQTSAELDGDAETPCYQLEVAVQTALGKTAGDAAFIQAKRCLDSHTPAPVKNTRTPGNGGRRQSTNKGHFSIGSLEPDILSFAQTDPASSPNFHSLSMSFPLDMVHLEGVQVGASEVLMVSGLDATDQNGVIQALEVNNGAVISDMFTLNLPNTNPISIVYDPDTSILYVLDVLNDEIVTVIDTDADLIPDTLFPISYATSATFPELQTALDVSINTASDGFDLILAFKDKRTTSAFNLDEQLVALFDDNGDNLADRSESFVTRDLVSFIPAFSTVLMEDMQSVVLFASTTADVEVRVTDVTAATNGELLGTATVPLGTNDVTVNLSRPLITGEFIKAVDLTNQFDVPNAAFEVQQAGGSGIPTVSEWGLVVMTLLCMAAGTIMFGRWRRVIEE